MSSPISFLVIDDEDAITLSLRTLISKTLKIHGYLSTTMVTMAGRQLKVNIRQLLFPTSTCPVSMVSSY